MLSNDNLTISRSFIQKAPTKVLEPISSELWDIKPDVYHNGSFIEALEEFQGALSKHSAATAHHFHLCQSYFNNVDQLEDLETRSWRNNLSMRGIPTFILPESLPDTTKHLFMNILGDDFQDQIISGLLKLNWNLQTSLERCDRQAPRL